MRVDAESAAANFSHLLAKHFEIIEKNAVAGLHPSVRENAFEVHVLAPRKNLTPRHQSMKTKESKK